MVTGTPAARSSAHTRDFAPSVRALADRAFSRAAGAPLVGGNRVRLLKDAKENYPAWLEAIAAARHHVCFESYIIHEDRAGAMFADALAAAARRGIRVRVVYDWLGGLWRTSRGFWNRLRAQGVEVRCYNPPRLDAPFGWISRDHRKVLAVDGVVGFVTGLCVGQMWLGDPERGLEPWRDTGIKVRGPAVADIERAFARVWAMTGPPIPDAELVPDTPAAAGTVSMRIVAGEPAMAGMLRVDQLVAALARDRVWLTDAYYAGTAVHVQALSAAARHGVDVRLLVPNATDVPLLRPLSRSGYRPLLDAGVRVFEWNGTMLHAKTAVADGRWARVGSTNLNITSWLGNWELDAVIEDEPFARQMEEMYLQDLSNATEIVLTETRRGHARRLSRTRRPGPVKSRGSAGRVAAGAVRVGNAIGAAFTNRRTLEPVEARLAVLGGIVLLALALIFAFVPGLLVYPVVVILVWMAAALLYRGYRLHRERTRT
jgi:cardiolipin synthase